MTISFDINFICLFVCLIDSLRPSQKIQLCRDGSTCVELYFFSTEQG